MIIRAIAVWFLILLFAVANGFVRERFLIPYFGELPGHVVSTFILSSVVLAAILITSSWVGFNEFSGAMIVGASWVALTLAFEFLVGHYLFGTSWEKLLADYDVLEGRIWPLVLVTELLAPVIAVWLRKG